MTDAEELAVLREFAEKMERDSWTCMGDFFVMVMGEGTSRARRIEFSDGMRGVAYGSGSIIAEDRSLAKCIIASRAKLQADRDAKDAPRLREENERMRDLLLRWCQSSSDAYFSQLIKESQAALKGAQA